jgi:iron complex transport system substrate-binding protein
MATPIGQAETFPLTVSDDLGREVTFARAPERIVSIAPSNTEILFALGLDDHVVAVDAFSDYPPEAAGKFQVGDYVEPDLELVVAATPDLVLAAGIHEATVLPALESLGVSTVVVEPETLDEVYEGIDLIGQVAGVPERADALTCELASRVAAVESAVAGAPAPRVFFELSPELYTAGPGSFIDDVITRARGQNIAADAAEMWPQLSNEAVVAADPEVILLADHEAGVTPEQVTGRPGWQEVDAAVQSRIVAIDPDLVARPGPRIVDGLEQIARILHPDRFPGSGS